jgi:hypothetical protein
MSGWLSTALKSPRGRWLVIIPGALIVFGLTLVIYINLAFPKTRCEFATHLKSPDEVADCYTCHVKASPKVAQDWYESKHGVMLVKCFVCHGQPDGQGSVPYAVSPNVNNTCRKCHDPSIKRMEDKYGLELNCTKCHPFHQNSLHHEAYEKPVAKTKID